MNTTTKTTTTRFPIVVTRNEWRADPSDLANVVLTLPNPKDEEKQWRQEYQGQWADPTPLPAPRHSVFIARQQFGKEFTRALMQEIESEREQREVSTKSKAELRGFSGPTPIAVNPFTPEQIARAFVALKPHQLEMLTGLASKPDTRLAAICYRNNPSRGLFAMLTVDETS